MDLFGSVASQGPPRQRSRSLPPATLTRWSSQKKALIIGDDNLESFGDTETDVFATSKGRLNHFRTLLRAYNSTGEVYSEVRRFVLVISHLDRRNAPTTNLTAVRNILSTAKTLFPHAKCAVVCDGVCSCEPQNVQDSIATLNTTLQASPPNQATVIPPPDDFTCVGGRWSEATRTIYKASIDSFLA